MKVRVGDFVMGWFEIYTIINIDGDYVWLEHTRWDARYNMLAFEHIKKSISGYKMICDNIIKQNESRMNICYNEVINDLIKKVFTYMKRS